MIGSKPKRLLLNVCKRVSMCTAHLSLQLCKALAPPYGVVCARLSLTQSLFLPRLLSLPPSPSAPCIPLTPVSGPSCQCSIMVLHELSVRQPLTTKSWNRLGGEMLVPNAAAAVSCQHSLITKLLYLMPSGNRNDFLSCYL